METQKTIFVTGITGNQGSAVARHSLNQKHTVVGLTRQANSDKANYWKAQGVTIVEGDLKNPRAFQEHLDKADAIFLVQALQRKSHEIQQGKQLINHIKSKNLNYTILRPASFYENHLFPRVAKDIKKGTYMSPLNKTCKQQMIGVDDIGKIASKVISNRETYEGKILSIATDEMQIAEIPQAFAEVLNKPVKYKKLPGFIARLAMGKDLYKMFKYMNKHDFSVVEDIEAIKNEFDISGDFKSWVSDHFSS